jgi:hypothetical protein
VSHYDAELLDTIGVERRSSRCTGETASVRGASRVTREAGVRTNERRTCCLYRVLTDAARSHPRLIFTLHA